jgi:hypothetical protein
MRRQLMILSLLAALAGTALAAEPVVARSSCYRTLPAQAQRYPCPDLSKAVRDAQAAAQLNIMRLRQKGLHANRPVPRPRVYPVPHRR